MSIDNLPILKRKEVMDRLYQGEKIEVVERAEVENRYRAVFLYYVIGKDEKNSIMSFRHAVNEGGKLFVHGEVTPSGPSLDSIVSYRVIE
ncbi:hypothetical protein CL616_01420 [archaeon]|nr:hypothetical protein [archaeon]|tara:strand:- start:42 stop:311 length:270 start_codon:yes stop_codon:yes gene_type:complete